MRAARPHRRAPDPDGRRCSRQTRLLAVRQVRRSVSVPPDQPSLRAHLDHCHNKPGVRRVAQRVRRRQDDNCIARPVTPHCDIVETGNDSWGFKNRDDDQATRARLVSAIPFSSDEASATAPTRRTRGSKLEADTGGICEPIDREVVD